MNGTSVSGSGGEWWMLLDYFRPEARRGLISYDDSDFYFLQSNSSNTDTQGTEQTVPILPRPQASLFGWGARGVLHFC